MKIDKAQIGLLLFPGVTQLDLTRPAEVFSASRLCDVHLIWKACSAVITGAGWSINPTRTFRTAPPLDVICIPGGGGQIDLMSDEETLEFIRQQAEYASLITSVCTGSLLLGAAGCLNGYRATSHWMSLRQLELFGAIPVQERIVCDRNRITGAGVSAGIDFALTVVDKLWGDEAAKEVQLAIEYDPAPPYRYSELIDPIRLKRLVQRAQERQIRRLEASKIAAARLGLR